MWKKLKRGLFGSDDEALSRQQAMEAQSRNLLFSKEHAWVRVEGDQAVIGISDYAQDHMGNLVLIELAGPGTRLVKRQVFGRMETVPRNKELLSPLTGTIIEVNQRLIPNEDDPINEPYIVNDDPYGEGWMLRMTVELRGELSDLMSEKEYLDHVSRVNEDWGIYNEE